MKIALWLPKYGVHIEDPCCYPLGFMYISAVLKKHHDVTVFNNNINKHDISDLIGYDAVFLTGFDEFKDENNRVISYCKELGIHTVIGGASATFDPYNQTADAVVIGEGESALKFATHLKGVFKTPPEELSKIPLPDYEGFGIETYHRLHSVRYMGVLTSRGCPHNCTFCAHTCKYRCRSIADVSAEIDLYINKYQVEIIVFNDNTLNPSKGRFRNICKMMKGKHVRWSAALRLDCLDDDLVKMAKEAGLSYAVVGVESFSQQKLDAMNKNITVGEIEEGLLLLEKYKVKYHGNVITGFAGESDESILAEFEDLKKRPWNIFPVYLQKFSGVIADTVKTNSYSKLFKEYIENKNMYCYPGA